MNPSKPYTYGMQIREMLEKDKTLTIEIIAQKMKQKSEFMSERLSLTKLHHAIGRLVDDQQIPLTNALVLATFTPLQQLYLRKAASGMSLSDFKIRCEAFTRWVVSDPSHDNRRKEDDHQA